MSVLYVYGITHSRDSLVRSPSWQAAQTLMRDANAPASWSRLLRGWRIRTDHLGDVLALAELTGWRIDMRGALPLEVPHE